jgi:hypothetical protein
MKSLTAVLDWGLGLICSLNSRTSLADTSGLIAMLESTGAQHRFYKNWVKHTVFINTSLLGLIFSYRVQRHYPQILI